MVEGLGVFRNHLEEVRVESRDAMALEDVCNLIDPPRERLVVARMRDANAVERPDVVAISLGSRRAT